MDNQDKIIYKSTLKQLGLTIISQRMATARTAIDQAQQTANQEEKSSAGDKYETGRAMSHLQKDMFSHQLAAYARELAALHAVNTDTLYNKPSPGAFVDCGALAFFIAAGLGKQDMPGRTVFFLSPQAPLARQLSQMKRGDPLSFNNQTLQILDVY